MKYIQRTLEPKIRKYTNQFPVVALTGARQTGKSTLLKHLFSAKQWQYVNLDQRGILERIESDPDLFVKDIDSNIIIDEAQKAPNLFHAIKWRVDEGTKSKIILSGSANFQLLKNVTETLAGRVGILNLYPFSLCEKFKSFNFLEILLKSPNISTLKKTLKKYQPLDDKNLFQHILWGGYPKLGSYKSIEQKLTWFENYRTTYIERDLRDLTKVADLSDFQRFYQILAFQAGNILNLSNIANNIGISIPTCKKYLQILEASYQFFLLQPYHLNIRKRLIKSPKIYIGDTGLGNYLMDHHSLKRLQSSGKFGAIVENMVIAEMLKNNSLLTKKTNFYFWRTSNGAEIDLIIEEGGKLIPVEIKTTSKVSPFMIRGMTDFMKLRNDKDISFGIVLYRGEKIYSLTDNILAIPIGYL